ncbi:uncharacterized protein LOC107221029 [Neodiprion lecontei]|uniref:Uncharacterized protein LOC107221029 n=1 Tax=Neodiprion lecontei TaxID=441921 RepID=A0ABM3GE72_NEOLC|nr:uncharacterized protein LOC107221029 [Neodiprion lecontei]
MRRKEVVTDDETESGESVEEEVTGSDESIPANSKKDQLFGIPNFEFSYKRLPKKCIKFSFLCVNGATFFSGITAFIISIWMLADTKLMSRLVGQRLFVTILLFVGLLTAGISFLGILSIVKKRRRFLTIVSLMIIYRLYGVCDYFRCTIC